MPSDKEGGEASVTKFVLCGTVRDYRSGVGYPGAPKITKNLENKPLGKLFLTPTNPQHSSASLFSHSSSDFSGTLLLLIEQLDADNFIITLSDHFTLKPVVPLTAEKLETKTDEGQLYLRCSSCQKRSLYILTTLSDTLPCTNCKKPLTIYHWTGRVGKLNTFSITDLTSLFTTKYLKTHGFIMRKVNLWVKDILGTMCYVDFRGKKLPSFYAFSEKGAVEYSKLPDELKLMRKELLPYLDRPTTSDITKRHSRQDQISLTHAAPDPLELQSIIDELKTKGVDVLSHLKELNKLTVSQTEITKELNNTDDINKPKCPSCGSSNFSIVTNKLGGAERCADCDYLKITGGDEDERQGTGTSQKADDNKVEKRPGNLDDSFF